MSIAVPSPARRSRRERLLAGTVVGVCVLAAFLLRVLYGHEAVMAPDGVRFQGNDAWYHARLIDNLLANFPHPLRFDPLARFPGGQAVTTPPLFDLLVAAVALMFGRGAPSQHLTETVAAYLPPVLGSIAIVPVFLIGRRLFGRAAGTLAALTLAVLPGQFLVRTTLGATDHHVAEVLLTTMAMLFLIQALAKWQELHSRRGSWAHATLAGACLALFFLTWSGAGLFAAIVVCWAALQLVVDHLAGRSRETPAVLAAAALVLPLAVVVTVRQILPRGTIGLLSLGGGLVLLAALLAASRWLAPLRASRWWIVAAPCVFLLAAAAIGHALMPGVVADVALEIGRMRGTRMTATVAEGMALLFPAGRFTATLASLQFASGFLLAPLGFALLVQRAWGEPRAEWLLCLTWTTVVIAATLGQNRFGYYAAVNVSLLSGAAASKLIDWGGLASPVAGRARERYRFVAAVMLVLVLLVPSLRVSLPTVKRDEGPPADVVAAVDWLRANTPDPFPGENAYLARYHLRPGERFSYPPAAYGVLNWWDHGYLITRRARRIPSSNPTQAGASETASVLLEQRDGEAHRRLREMGMRYVMIDRLQVYAPGERISLIGWFPAIAFYSGREESEFQTRYLYRGPDGATGHVSMLRPEYYRTMMVRLYTFLGSAVEPQDSTWLVASRPMRDERGEELRLIEDLRRFATWREAEAFLAEHPEKGYEVMGRDPARSCVPLAALEGFRQVYPAPTAAPRTALGHKIKIFEVLDEAAGPASVGQSR